jgi:hypothetical protein
MDFDKIQLMKALATFCIEKVLLQMGKPVYEKVVNKLETEFNCYLPDCYDHPECLERTLKSTFGNSYKSIVEAIREELIDNFDDKGIRKLVQTISRR